MAISKFISNNNSNTEGYFLETDTFSFKPVPGLNRNTTVFNNAGYYDHELYTFGGRDLGAKKFNISKKKWNTLNSYTDKVTNNELERWSCCFINNFSFETILFGNNISNAQQYKKPLRDSILDDVNINLDLETDNFNDWDVNSFCDSNNSSSYGEQPLDLINESLDYHTQMFDSEDELSQLWD